jgi:hypothetical protein
VITVGHPSRMWMRALNLLLAVAALWGMVVRGTEPSERVTRLRTVEFVDDRPPLEPQEIPRAADERDAPDVARRARPVTERTDRSLMLACYDVNRGSPRC